MLLVSLSCSSMNVPLGWHEEPSKVTLHLYPSFGEVDSASFFFSPPSPFSIEQEEPEQLRVLILELCSLENTFEHLDDSSSLLTDGVLWSDWVLNWVDGSSDDELVTSSITDANEWLERSKLDKLSSEERGESLNERTSEDEPLVRWKEFRCVPSPPEVVSTASQDAACEDALPCSTSMVTGTFGNLDTSCDRKQWSARTVELLLAIGGASSHSGEGRTRRPVDWVVWWFDRSRVARP